MADRTLIQTQEQLTTVDSLNSQQNYYIALSRFMGELVDFPALGGFLCTQTVVPSLNVLIGAGEIYSQEATDTTDYGTPPNDIPADPTLILKQGIYYGGEFATPAPVTIGDSINYLIQIAFQELDGVPEPRVFFTGPVTTINTQRQDIAVVEIKAGTPAPTGTQGTPTPDAGFVGAWVITVAYGQTTVTSGNISQYSGAPFFGAAYGGALQDFLTLAIANGRYVINPQSGGGATYFMMATIQAPQVVSTSLTDINYTAVIDPQGWWTGTTFTPNIPCVVQFAASIFCQNSGGAQEYNMATSDGLFGQSNTLPAGGVASSSLAAIEVFSGSNSLSFYAQASALPMTITGGTVVAIVIVN